MPQLISNAVQADMDLFDDVTIGMTAEKIVTVTSEMTVGHFVAHMSRVYATPMMILHMEMAAGAAIASYLPEGFVNVGMDVKVRHLAASGPHGPRRLSSRPDRFQERRGRGLGRRAQDRRWHPSPRHRQRSGIRGAVRHKASQHESGLRPNSRPGVGSKQTADDVAKLASHFGDML
jgi:hypothetical protein